MPATCASQSGWQGAIMAIVSLFALDRTGHDCEMGGMSGCAAAETVSGFWRVAHASSRCHPSESQPRHQTVQERRQRNPRSVGTSQSWLSRPGEKLASSSFYFVFFFVSLCTSLNSQPLRLSASTESRLLAPPLLAFPLSRSSSTACPRGGRHHSMFVAPCTTPTML